MNNLVLGVSLFLVAQILIWFQTNAQFINPWAKNNIVIMSILGVIISYIFIKATWLVANHFDGLIWPGRFIVFGLGMISFALLTWAFMGESINIKTTTSLILSSVIILIQIFWR